MSVHDVAGAELPTSPNQTGSRKQTRRLMKRKETVGSVRKGADPVTQVREGYFSLTSRATGGEGGPVSDVGRGRRRDLSGRKERGTEKREEASSSSTLV